MTEKQARAIVRKRVRVARDGLGWAVFEDDIPVEFTWSRGLATILRVQRVEALVKQAVKEAKQKGG